MPFGLVQTVKPYAYPVSVAEQKDWLSIPAADTTHDAKLTPLIAEATERVERDSGKQLLAATWKLTLDCFPLIIKPPRSPLIAVSSITYVDTDGTTTTFAASKYRVDTNTEPGRIEEAWGEVWPAERNIVASVTVTYTAGYAAPFTVNTTTDVLTAKGRTYTNGDLVRLSNTGGELPGGLATLTDYYVVGVSGSTLQLSLTSGGSAIDITSSGTGTSFIGVVPEEYRTAIKRIVGVRFEYREADDKAAEIEVAISRITAGLGTGEIY